MPDASGTPSANYLIPKFNTAVDPPSGKGTNTIVDFVDTLLKNTFVNKPSGIITGETPVWNSGTGTWDRSSITKIGVGSVAALSGTTNATVTAANTDLAAANGSSPYWRYNITSGSLTTGTLRSLGAGVYSGQRVLIRNSSAVGYANGFVIKEVLAGGSGATFHQRNAQDLQLLPGDSVEYFYDGANWIESNRDIFLPRLRVERGTAQSIPNGAQTTLTGASALSGGSTDDPNGVFTYNSGTGFLTQNAAYLVAPGAWVAWANAGTTQNMMTILMLQGGELVRTFGVTGFGGVLAATVPPVVVGAGGVWRVDGYQGSGVALNANVHDLTVVAVA